MAKRGGFPGGGMPGNMANLMKQVTVSGKREVLGVELQEEVVDPEDIEMLQDLVVAAVNEALRQVDEANSSVMNKLTGGIGGGMPGLF